MGQRFTSSRLLRCRRGGALLEMAFVLPMLLALCMGGAEFGLAFYVKHALQQASAIGVRTAILPGSTNASVSAAVTSQMQLCGLPLIPIQVATTPTTVSGAPRGTAMAVSVSCKWGDVGVNPLPPFLGGLASTRTLSTTASMVHE